MRQKADRVAVKKETIVADNADSMNEEIETKAELLVVYTEACYSCFSARRCIILKEGKSEKRAIRLMRCRRIASD